jgi:hypothetical protein
MSKKAVEQSVKTEVIVTESKSTNALSVLMDSYANIAGGDGVTAEKVTETTSKGEVIEFTKFTFDGEDAPALISNKIAVGIIEESRAFAGLSRVSSAVIACTLAYLDGIEIYNDFGLKSIGAWAEKLLGIKSDDAKQRVEVAKLFYTWEVVESENTPHLSIAPVNEYLTGVSFEVLKQCKGTVNKLCGGDVSEFITDFVLTGKVHLLRTLSAVRAELKALTGKGEVKAENAAEDSKAEDSKAENAAEDSKAEDSKAEESKPTKAALIGNIAAFETAVKAAAGTIPADMSDLLLKLSEMVNALEIA